MLPRGGNEGRRSRVSSVMDFVKLQLELAVSDYDCSVLRSLSHLALATDDGLRRRNGLLLVENKS